MNLRIGASSTRALLISSAVFLLCPAAVRSQGAPAAGGTSAPAASTTATPSASQPSPLPPELAALDGANPLRPLPGKLLGHDQGLDQRKPPLNPEKARLGRWLFFDKRISKDGTLSCASCHDPRHAFSEQTPVSTGIGGQKGKRKAPSFVNAVYAFYPQTFWDGRASSLEEQAAGPMANPIEMGSTHELIVKSVGEVKGYAPFFQRAFGDAKVTLDRITGAIAEYERTRISGNSPYDRWKSGKDEKAVGDEVKLGDQLFFGKALCSQCHVGNAFTDSRFHNLGIGWNAATKTFADNGRGDITQKKEELGAFKTPGLRDVALHAPYMHDGSVPTLAAVVEHYRIGGTPNPYLDQKMEKLGLTGPEAEALVKMMEALTGEGWQDVPPALFPQ